ncbi:hypothetical protein JL721_2638 [Aureococcus anophagefferens]|nr:hypothetical protein JL721_2638 [Aureococcus anophagefferens]
MPERAPLRAYRVATALGVVVNAADATPKSLADDRLPRDSSAVHVAVALTGAAWLLGARFATDAADAAAAMMLQSHATSRAVAAAGLSDAGRVAGALLATLVVPRALEAGAHAATGLYARAPARCSRAPSPSTAALGTPTTAAAPAPSSSRSPPATSSASSTTASRAGEML